MLGTAFEQILNLIRKWKPVKPRQKKKSESAYKKELQKYLNEKTRGVIKTEYRRGDVTIQEYKIAIELKRKVTTSTQLRILASQIRTYKSEGFEHLIIVIIEEIREDFYRELIKVCESVMRGFDLQPFQIKVIRLDEVFKRRMEKKQGESSFGKIL